MRLGLCLNCGGEGHMARQCPTPRRGRGSSNFRRNEKNSSKGRPQSPSEKRGSPKRKSDASENEKPALNENASR